MKQKLANYFRAGFPGIAINTYEEQRAVADVMAAAKDCERSVITWSATEGARMVSPQVREFPDTNDLQPALLIRTPDSVFILRDINGWPFDRDPVLTRAFRDLLTWSGTEEGGSCVVVIGTDYKPEPSFEKQMVVVDYTLPDKDTLREIAKNIAESGGVEFNGSDEVVRALSGLSTAEASNACALSIIETDRLDPATIYREKVQGVKKSGLLEIITPDPRGLDAVGGLDLIKVFIAECAETIKRYEEAAEYPISMMKGILAVGPPGTGKSLLAKVIGTILGIPILRWDVATTFGQFVGNTERDTKRTLDLAEANSPCALWIDEADKAFAGTSSGGSTDSGVGMRMFGQVLSWMQERTKPVFLFATANDVTNLPSALYRKGRFDEIFALDLPNQIEREAIFTIHLKKRKRQMNKFVKLFSGNTKGFVGAEIEAVIESAMRRSFSERRDVTEQDVLNAINRTVPLSTTAKDEIDRMRAWSKSNATPASSPETVTPQFSSTRKIGKSTK